METNKTAAPKTYTAIQGDRWDSIAYKLWGREALARQLLAANPDMADVPVFAGGEILAVPDVAVQPATGNLPPWYTA